MNRLPARKATLVVIEFGGSWPRWLEPSRAGNMAVVAQHYEGEPCSLITQVASRITRLEAVGWKAGSIVFVSNGHAGPAARAARSVLIRGLVARLEESAGALILTTNAPLGSRPCRELNRLASSIRDEARGGRVPAIAVRTDSGAATYDCPQPVLKRTA